METSSTPKSSRAPKPSSTAAGSASTPPMAPESVAPCAKGRVGGGLFPHVEKKGGRRAVPHLLVGTREHDVGGLRGEDGEGAGDRSGEEREADGEQRGEQAADA